MQQPLRDAYVDDDHPRREVFCDGERRQANPLRSSAGVAPSVSAERAQCLRRDQRAAGRPEEIIQIASPSGILSPEILGSVSGSTPSRR